MAIGASYLPSLMYYNYFKRKHNEFLKDVSNRYKDRIKDEEFRRFRREVELGPEVAKDIELNNRRINK